MGFRSGFAYLGLTLGLCVWAAGAAAVGAEARPRPATAVESRDGASRLWVDVVLADGMAHRRLVRETTAPVRPLTSGWGPTGRTGFVTWEESGARWFSYSRNGGENWSAARRLSRGLRPCGGEVASGDRMPGVPETLQFPPGGGLYLVQFKTISLPEWRAALEGAGAELLAFLPEDVHVVRLGATRAAAVGALEMVERVEPYHPWYRLSCELQAWLQQPIDTAPERMRVRVAAFEWGPAGRGRLAALAGDLGAEIVALPPDRDGIALEVDREQLVRIASHDDVEWVDSWALPTVAGEVEQEAPSAGPVAAGRGDDGPRYAAEALAGELPGEASSLSVTRGTRDELTLSWGAGCGSADGYSVYRGDLALGYGTLAPEPGLCDVTANSVSVPVGTGKADFFLIVPHAGGYEGGYGSGSEGPRAPAAGACHPAGEIAACDPPGDWDAVDWTLFETLDWIAEQERRYSLWKEAANAREFVVSRTPAYVVRRDENGAAVKAYLVNFPSPPAAAVELQHPFSGLGTVHRYDGEMGELDPRLDFDFALSLSGRPTYAIAYTAQNMDRETLFGANGYTRHDVWVDMFVHEFFHHYQFHGPDSDWVDRAWGGGLPWSGYPVTSDNIALSLLERRALLAGREAATVPEIADALRHVLAIRDARTQLPEAVKEHCRITNSTSTNAQGAIAPQGIGQSFVACVGGSIRTIRVEVASLDDPRARLELQAGSNSWPGGYSQDVILAPGENVIRLNVPFEVESGAEYSLGVFPAAGALSLRSSADSYAGGRAFFIVGFGPVDIAPSPDLVFEVSIEGPNYVDRMDREQERAEGTAMHVSQRLFVNSGRSAYAQELHEWLDRSTWTDHLTSRDAFMSGFFAGGWYSTGSTIVDLLDRVTTLDWRSAFPSGATPVEVLETLYGSLSQQAIDQLVAEAQQTYGWQEILDQVAAIPPEYLDPATPAPSP